MKRTKWPARKALTDAGKLIATAYTISRFVPHCEHLAKYQQDWASWDDAIYAEEIREDIEINMNLAIERSEPQQIAEAFLPIRTNHRGAIPIIKMLLDKRYHIYLDSDYKGIPSMMVRPLVTFFPLRRNVKGTVIALNEDIVKRTGMTTVRFHNTPLVAKDVKTLFSLPRLMCKSEVHISGGFIRFKTTSILLAKEMRLSCPYNKSTKDAIKNSLARLRGCVIEWTTNKGGWSIGGILAKAQKHEEGDDGMIEISIDFDFWDMFNTGYININPDTLYGMNKDAEILFYVWLLGQEAFTKTGTLGTKHGIRLAKVFNAVNLGGLRADVSISQQRYEVREILQHFKEKSIIGGFNLRDDRVRIFSGGSIAQTKESGVSVKNKPMTRTKKKPKPEAGVCPHGHRFGEDCELFDECYRCDNLQQCDEDSWSMQKAETYIKQK